MTRIGSDHAPLLLSSGDAVVRPPPRFHFETFWLRQAGFAEAVANKWYEAMDSPHRAMSVLDTWHHCTKLSRQFMRGWEANLGRDLRLHKAELVEAIKALDGRADQNGLDPDEWMERYALKDNLMSIYQNEEIYWRLRGRLNWTLRGDSNTAYFQAIANGRRRRASITALWDGPRLLLSKEDIRSHVNSFYKDLFAGQPRSGVSLSPSAWGVGAQVSEAENLALLAPFSVEEVEFAVKSMRPDSAPGPDGLPVRFFVKFWKAIKWVVMAIFRDFQMGISDASRLNYGIVTLIPNVTGATDIRQFRPITLIPN